MFLLRSCGSQTEAQGWSVLAGEDEQLEAEIAAIERVQKQVRWHSVEIAIRQEQESSKAESYTFNSKSRDKAKAMAAAGCFSHALRYAQQPVESLAEPQVATLKAAVNRIEDDYGYMPLRDLVMGSSRSKIPIHTISMRLMRSLSV